jgi:hypothetical protein
MLAAAAPNRLAERPRSVQIVCGSEQQTPGKVATDGLGSHRRQPIPSAELGLLVDRLREQVVREPHERQQPSRPPG